MARELITSWTEHQAAIDRLLALAGNTIHIYDEDLLNLKLSGASRLDVLKRLLGNGSRDVLRIAVRNAEPLRQQPLLMQLLSTYGHLAAAQQSPPELSRLRDNLLLIDGRHALIRFERDLPRSKLLIDEPEALRPYLERFAEIWSAGGESISGTTLGL